MTEANTAAKGLSPVGCIAPLVLVLLPAALSYWKNGAVPAEEWFSLLLPGVLLAIPFGYLALEGTKAWFPWAVATVLTGLLWGAVFAIVTISAQGATGVSFGIIPLMIVSPMVVTLSAWLAVPSSEKS